MVSYLVTIHYMCTNCIHVVKNSSHFEFVYTFCLWSRVIVSENLIAILKANKWTYIVCIG